MDPLRLKIINEEKQERIVCQPVLDDEWEEVGHGRGPELPEGVVVEAGVHGHHVVDVLLRNRHA